MHFRCKTIPVASWLGKGRPRHDESPGELVTCAVPKRDCGPSRRVALASNDIRPRRVRAVRSVACNRVRVIASTHARLAVFPRRDRQLRSGCVWVAGAAGTSGVIARSSPSVFRALPLLLRVRLTAWRRLSGCSAIARAGVPPGAGPSSGAAQLHHYHAAQLSVACSGSSSTIEPSRHQLYSLPLGLRNKVCVIGHICRCDSRMRPLHKVPNQSGSTDR
jgi:hypothetical protein